MNTNFNLRRFRCRNGAIMIYPEEQKVASMVDLGSPASNDTYLCVYKGNVLNDELPFLGVMTRKDYYEAIELRIFTAELYFTEFLDYESAYKEGIQIDIRRMRNYPEYFGG